MKIHAKKEYIELTPEDNYDYFLLGRISLAVSEYNYDFDSRKETGKARTIEVFRIKKEAVIDRMAKVN